MATTKATTLAHTLGGIAGSIETAEINRLDGLTGDIQTQLDLKAPIASPTLTGTPNLGSNPTITLGTNTTLPDDHIIKIEQTTKSNVISRTFSGTSIDFEDITGMSCNITPQSNSKVLVNVLRQDIVYPTEKDVLVALTHQFLLLYMLDQTILLVPTYESEFHQVFL